MRHSVILTIASLLCLALASCEKKASSEDIASETDKISEWVAEQMESNQDYSASYIDGVVRLTTVKGEGSELSEGGKVSFRYTLYNFSSAKIGSSTEIYSNMDSDSVSVVLGEDNILKGLEYGLKGVKAGEQCYIVFSSDFGYGSAKTGTIPANTPLCYDINICTVEN